LVLLFQSAAFCALPAKEYNLFIAPLSTRRMKFP